MGGRRKAESHSKNASRDDWCTPPKVLDVVRGTIKNKRIGLDPCANPNSIVNALFGVQLPKFRNVQRTEHDPDCDVTVCSCLSFKEAVPENTDWAAYHSIFCNHPYGRKISNDWTQRCVDSARRFYAKLGRRQDLFVLAPASLTTKWFSAHWNHATSILFFDGRLKFLGAPSVADFESALVYYGDEKRLFAEHASKVGRVIPVSSVKYKGKYT